MSSRVSLLEQLPLPAHIREWSARVQGEGEFSGEFVQLLPVGPYSGASEYFQEVDAKEPRSCVRSADGRWLVLRDDAWIPAPCNFRFLNSTNISAAWPVLVAMDIFGSSLGAFAPLAGHCNGMPVLGNLTFQNEVDSVLFWCQRWVLGKLLDIRHGGPCESFLGDETNRIAGSWQSVDLTGRWSVFANYDTELLGVLDVNAVPLRSVGLLVQPELRASLQKWHGRGMLFPTKNGLQLPWLFEASSPWPAIYVGEVTQGDTVVKFPGGGMWIRSEMVEDLKSRSLRYRAEDLSCAYANLSAGCNPQYTCTNFVCTCALPWAPGINRGLWPFPAKTFRFMTNAAWVTLLIFLAILWSLGWNKEVSVTSMRGGAPSRFKELQAIRFFGAVHIVLFHCYPHLPMVQWGGPAWISWFFMLSGFVLSWQRLHTTQRDSYLVRLFRRILGIYPLHIVALGLSLLTLDDLQISSPDFVQNLFLVQSWRMDGAPVGEPWNHVNWFLSTLFAYYICFDAVFLRISKIPEILLPYVLVLCWLWSFWGELIRMSFGLNLWNTSEDLVNRLRDFRYTHPLSHYQSFVFGMVLARVAGGPQWRVVSSAAVTLACVGLGMMFCFVGPWRGNLCFWNGALLPVYGTIVAGFAWRVDTVFRFLDCSMSESLGEVAWPMYILHIVLLHLYQRYWRLEFPPVGIAYPLLVAAGSYFAVVAIERPTRRILKLRSRSVKIAKVDGA